MKKSISLQAIGLLVGVAVLVLGASVSAYAVESTTNTPEDSSSQTSKNDNLRSQARDLRTQQRADNKTERKDRLDARRLKVCQAHQKRIAEIMQRVTTRGDRHMTFISKVATRVEAFYQKSGKTAVNYESLKADVEAKQAVAVAAVATTRQSQTSFDCTGDNPKAVLQSFRTNIKSQRTAMKDYRTSVKNLITAVKSAVTSEGVKQ